jgi:uncharacterized protein
MGMARVAEVWRYPVKSLAGERLESCLVEGTGLSGDRRWALVDGAPKRAGKLLTNTEHARLMTYGARIVDGGVEITYPDGAVLEKMGADLARRVADEASRPVRLRDLPGGNFDDSPVLVVNLASVRAFAAEVGMLVDHRRFRANLYLDDMEVDEELGWLGRRIRAGEAELQVVSRCERCVVVTRDPSTTVATPAILRALAQRHETCMGVYCVVTRPGLVGAGDLVEAASTL